MKIISTPIGAPSGGGGVDLFDVVVHGHHLLVGVVVGVPVHDGLHLSRQGHATFTAFGIHSSQHHAAGRVHMVEIKGLDRARKAPGQVFAAAQNGDSVLFVCADERFAVSVLQQLNIQANPADGAAH